MLESATALARFLSDRVEVAPIASTCMLTRAVLQVLSEAQQLVFLGRGSGTAGSEQNAPYTNLCV